MSNQGPKGEKIKLLLCVFLSILETVRDVMCCGFVFNDGIPFSDDQPSASLLKIWALYDGILKFFRKQYKWCVCVNVLEPLVTAILPPLILQYYIQDDSDDDTKFPSQNPLFMFSHQSLKSVSSLIWFSFVILRYSRKCELNALSTSWNLHTIDTCAHTRTHTSTQRCGAFCVFWWILFDWNDYIYYIEIRGASEQERERAKERESFFVAS